MDTTREREWETHLEKRFKKNETNMRDETKRPQ